MLTAAQYKANLRSAANEAANKAGVRDTYGAIIPPNQWTQEQRATYNKEIARIILAHPGSFSAESLNIAATTNTDYGLRGHHFDSALDIALDSAAPLGNALKSVGEGAVAALNSAKWLLPLALVGFVAILLWGEYNKRKGPPAASA